MRTLMVAACLLALSGMPFNHLKAQATVNLEGSVTNPAGAPVPNVKVDLQNPATGQTRTATTDNNGHYRFNNVQAGHYRIMTVGPTGRTAAQPVDWDVQAGAPNIVNLTMAAATVSTDTITANTIPTQTNNAQVEHNWNTPMAVLIPQPNLVPKDGNPVGAYNLTLTSEGVTTGPGPARGPAVGGQDPIFDNFRVAGADNNNKAQPGPLVYMPNTATLDTQLFQNQATPVFGHSLGGNINSTTLSGPNEIHGQLYDFVQNRNLNAVEPQFAQLGLSNDRPRYDQNRIGGTVGFPIRANKVFFLGNFEYIPLGFLAPPGALSFAPTPAGFSTLASLPGVSATNLAVLQRAVGNVSNTVTSTTTFDGTTIPLGAVNSLQRGFQNLWVGTGSVDFNLATSDSLHLRYNENQINANNSGQTLTAFTTPRDTTLLVASVSEDHVFTPSITNQFRAVYNRSDNSVSQIASPFPGLSAFPNISIGGASNLFLGTAQVPKTSVWNTYEGHDTVGFTTRGHNLRIGADVMRYISATRGVPAFNGDFAYSSLDRYLRDQTPDILAQQGFGSSYFADNRTLLTGWIQDDWAIRPNATINLGVRYYYNTLPNALRNQGLLGTAPGSVPEAIGSLPSFFSIGEPHTQKRNFAPNVGIAWSPTSARSSVIRAGFGILYDALYDPYTLFGGQFFPFTSGALVTNTAPIGFGTGFLAGGGLANPVPGGAPFGSLTAAQAKALTSSVVANQQLPYSMQYNFSIQQKLFTNMVAEVKYLGAQSRHLPLYSFVNAISAVTPQRSLPVFTTAPSQATLNALPLTLSQLQAFPTNPLASSGFTNPITTIQNVANLNYNALAVDLNQRMGSLNLIANYTWSHNISQTTGSPLDLTFGREKADSLFDRRQHASISGVFDVAPLFKNTFSVVRNIVADMSISGTYLYQTPARFPALSNSNLDLLGFGVGTPALFNGSGVRNIGSGVIPLTNSAGQVVAWQATNPSARFISGAQGVFAPPVRNAIPLNPVNNVDLAVTKRFNYHDRWAIDIRADAYNLFNHSQFTGVPLNNFNFQQPNLFTNLQQLNLFTNFLTPGTPSFANAATILPSNARVLQLALKVAF